MRQRIVQCIQDRDWRCRVGSILAVALLIVVVIYGRIVLSGSPAPVHLVVYAFSTQEEVLTQSLFPAFEEVWEAETGRDLIIEGVFGPSGTLAGQINLGAPADVALFSHAQHITHLKVGRRIKLDTQPIEVGYTPMVIVTRPGNPAGIAEFSDLAQPGLRLLHADPRTSGAGQWAVLAEYGSALQADARQALRLDSGQALQTDAGQALQTDAGQALQTGAGQALRLDSGQAQMQLQAIWRNVRLLGASARATMTLFELGAGDAFVTYEQDALLAQERGVPLEVVVPARTIVANHVAVLVDHNVKPAERPVCRAFLDFLQSAPAQQALGRYHLRPARLGGQQFAEISQPFTVDDLGGWSQAYSRLVEGLWQTEIEPGLHLEPPPQVLDAGG